MIEWNDNEHKVTQLIKRINWCCYPVQWKGLANAAKERSCYWRFLLLKLSIIRADILSDGNGDDMAEIEALLEEASELVDGSQQKNPNYYL